MKTQRVALPIMVFRDGNLIITRFVDAVMLGQWVIHPSLGPDDRSEGEYPLAGTQTGTCRSCGAAIAWTKTAKGHAIPLDLKHVVQYNGAQFAPTHFAYCPHGPHWRHKR